MEQTIARHAMIRPGDGILVGLSGGVDSWALLLGLWKLRARYALEIHAGIVNHGLRPEAAQEAAHTAAQCAERGIPCTIVRLRLGDQDVTAKPRVSQAHARDARLRALERLARKLHCRRIALGHQAEDQAETVLFRIVRGTGLRGLAGIPYCRGPFVRPLLDVRRAAIERFVKRAGLTPVCDPSNADRRFARARVRHDWLPFLRTENPRLCEALLRLAEEAREAVALGVLGPMPESWSQATRATVRSLLSARAGSKLVDVPGGRIEVRYGEVHSAPRSDWTDDRELEPVSHATAHSSASKSGSIALLGPGRVCLDPKGPVIEVEVLRKPPDERAVFDADAVEWPLQIRAWQPGDRMRPRGGVGSRKLQDLFVDAKIPRRERHHLPILASRQGDILFVPGLRPSEVGRPGAHTRRWLVVRCARDPRLTRLGSKSILAPRSIGLPTTCCKEEPGCVKAIRLFCCG